MRKVVVEQEDLRYNLDRLLKKAGTVPVWAVLKGNGYGLGLEPMASLCLQAGIRRFAVTEPDEVQTIRNLSADSQILLLRPTNDREELNRLLDLQAIATVASVENANVLNGLAGQRGTVVECHVKIDTGMGRYGFLPGDLEQILSVYQNCDNLAVSGIYTHFHSAFCSERATFHQADKFHGIVEQLHSRGIETGAVHCANSNAFLRWPELHHDGVRLGSALLGRVAAKSDLRRIGRCEVSVDDVRWLNKGQTTGYGAGWKAKKPTKTAVLPVGWYHGFGAEYGNDIFRFRDCLRHLLAAVKHMIFPKKLYVTIGGKKCPVLGHVGMLHTVCDVTKVDCHLGDVATVDINPLLLKGTEIEFI